MSDGLRRDGNAPEFETASKALLRQLSRTNEQMAAAEPGTDDFLDAYQESQRLRELYHYVRETWEVPPEVWSVAEGDPGSA